VRSVCDECYVEFPEYEDPDWLLANPDYLKGRRVLWNGKVWALNYPGAGSMLFLFRLGRPGPPEAEWVSIYDVQFDWEEGDVTA
jgi:hypothetical protein